MFSIIAFLILGKGIAAAIAGHAFGYARAAGLTTWALTLPQVAATLAAMLVGYTAIAGDVHSGIRPRQRTGKN